MTRTPAPSVDDFADPPSRARRLFIRDAGRGLVLAGAGGAAATTSSGAPAQALPQQSPPAAMRLRRDFAPGEREGADPPAPAPPAERVGFAVVGLGRLSLEEILPALSECRHARLAALVSGTPDKLRAVAERYGVPAGRCYDYRGFDALRDAPDVQVVYVVLPNSMHREFTERAAAAGKHVLTEKPMATSVADCDAMIAACARARRTLMVAYRMQYEPLNREAVRLARSGELGRIRTFTAENAQTQGAPDQWRLKRALAGGGALPDIGIYCLNAARYVTGEEPIEVSGHVWSTPGDARFAEVEEACAFMLRFPSGVMASCQTSYAAHTSKRMRIGLDDGWIDLDPAFAYHGLRLRVARKLDERTEQVAERQLQQKNQFALEMDHMARCVAAGVRPRTPGEEGRQDQRLMEAIYESARSGRPVKLAAVAGLDSTRGAVPTD